MRWVKAFLIITVTLTATAVLGGVVLIAIQQGGGQLEVVWGKQFGTIAMDSPDSVALDPQGNVCISGVTKGNLFGNNNGGQDIFVIKLNSDGQVIWNKQLGTQTEEESAELAVDGMGNIYVATMTEGEWFGKGHGRRDIVIMKLSTDGQLLWGKRIGTNDDEVFTDIAADSKDCIYIASITTSVTKSITGVYYDGVITKLDSNGNILWSKQFRNDMVFNITIDRQGCIYVGGIKSDGNTYLSKLTSSGEVIWRRAEQNTEDESFEIRSIGVDRNGDVYVVGGLNVYVDENKLVATPDAFITKYSQANGERMWLKRFRSQGEGKIDEEFIDVVVDGQGNIYAVGMTEGSLFGNHLGDADVIVAKIDGAGNVTWGKQWGTEKGEVGIGIVLDSRGHIYIVGGTNGNIFAPNAGETDVFIGKFKQ